MCNKPRYLLAYKIFYAKPIVQLFSGGRELLQHMKKFLLFHMSGSDITLEYVEFLVARVI